MGFHLSQIGGGKKNWWRDGSDTRYYDPT
jgi:hypothetical protein